MSTLLVMTEWGQSVELELGDLNHVRDWIDWFRVAPTHSENMPGADQLKTVTEGDKKSPPGLRKLTKCILNNEVKL